VIGVAASAGGVEALRGFVAALPAGFPAAVLVVLHIPPTGPTVLPQILARAGQLPARLAQDGEALAPGVILVAPPGRHLALSGGHARLLAGARNNGHRPSADILLRSLADSLGRRASGVVLSGMMDDGAAGLAAIRRAGGLALVQAPADALFRSMPLAAIEAADPQVIAPVPELVDPLCRWLAGLGEEVAVTTAPGRAETGPADRTGRSGAGPELTSFTCIECGGTLWLHDEYGVAQLRCRVGHTFSVEGLFAGKQSALERALWAAVVALEERAALARRVVKRLENVGRGSRAEHFRRDITTAEDQARVLREVISELISTGSVPYHDGDPNAESA
jgi:two-component system, chemotaxis family, protein-glutamate methylesterase/glutaminase